MIPWSLYWLQARDVQVRWLDPIYARGSNTVAAVQVIANAFTVPQGHMMILTAVAANAAAGAAQNNIELNLQITVDAVGGDRRFHRGNVVNNFVLLNWEGWILVPQGSIVQALGEFSAGAAANTVSLDIFGILIPRGNVERP